MRGIFVFASMAVLLGSQLLFLSGCGSSSDSTTTLVFWALGAEGENVENLLPEFERRHPEIKVKVQSIPWTAAHEKLLTAYAGETTPDLSQLGNTWIPEFTLLNGLEPLDSWIDQSSTIKKENYFSGIWETNVIDGRVFGIPWYVDTRVMFYRRDILERAGYDHPPRTWQEWYDVSRRIKKLPGHEAKYAVLLPTNEWVPFVITGLQAGSTLLRENNQYGDFSAEPFRRAFSFVMKFYDDKLAPVGVTQVTNIYQGIAEGFFTMYITGPWNLGEFRRRLPAELQDRWMTAPLPGPEAQPPGVSLAGGSSLVIFKSSRKKAEAWKLIEYLSETPRQIEFYTITGDLPAVKEAWNDTALAGPQVKAFYDQLERVVPTPKIPEWEQIAMKVQQYAEAAASRHMSIEQALAALDADVDVILEKRRWMMEKRAREQ